jgi:methyl-accepting chemotaxis protein
MKNHHIEPEAASFESASITDRLSIARKLAVMLLVPVAGLMVFATLQITERLGVVRSMSRLEDLTSLAISSSQLVHELQRERGRTANYLAREESDSSDMQAHRQRTDEALAEFRVALGQSELDGDLRRLADEALRSLQELGSQRSGITSRNADTATALDYYTGTISSVITLVSAIVERANTPSVALTLVSLEALVRLKEMAGLERARVVAVLGGAHSTDQESRDFARIVGMQAGFEEIFLAHASDGAVREYRSKMTGGFVDDVTRIRDVAMSRLAQNRRAATDQGTDTASADARTERVGAEEWWRVATARIDALYEIEQLLEHHVLDEVRTLRASASWALAFFAALAALCVLAAIGLSYFLARSMIRAFTEASETLRRVVGQISGFVRQQASSTSETATAVSQTTTTVQELRKTAETASERSSQMSSNADQSKSASDQALNAVGHGTEAMQHIRAEVEGIAENILELSEKNIHIGEIVQSVNAIAEQSNLLAVNASIEAAKAGEHGKGFSVVAAEVKALAQQSKQATDQIRAILTEIQKSSNGAVMITEQGVKRVEEGSNLIEELGRTIRSLGSAVEESSDTASQISLISSQQLAGIEQITEAMRNIGTATAQNAEGAKQLEAAADQVRMVSARVLEIVQGRQMGSRGGLAQAER